jgi:hypothetical protein
MEEITFSKLFQRQQGCSFPVLIELEHPKKTPSWYFTSNDKDVLFNNQTYTAVPMSYKFPSSRDGVPHGGTLEIDLNQQRQNPNNEYEELLKWFDEIDHQAVIYVVGLINEQGEITPISQIAQCHGSVTWDGEKISWTLGADDRMNMQINPYIFDTEALTG